MTIQEFAAVVEQDTKLFLAKRYPGPGIEFWRPHWTVKVKPGRKYTKVDVGRSGAFMVDAAGNIFGIKGYGVIHTGYRYGTLETVHEWFWGDMHPIKKKEVAA